MDEDPTLRPQATFRGVERLSTADVEQPQGDRQNVFYDVKYTALEPGERRSTDEVRALMAEISGKYAELRRSEPDASDEALRSKLRASLPASRPLPGAPTWTSSTASRTARARRATPR